MLTRTDRLTVRIAVLASLAACASDPATTAPIAPTVRDSAGVQIVENPPAADTDLPFWTVDTVPAVTIGQLDGDPAYEFTSIKNVTQLANGMIVILDGQGESASEFRFYDPAGRHVATHGRAGQGPGEFQWVNFMGGVGGDTVLGVDFPLRRISKVSAAHGFVGSTQLDEAHFKRLIGDDITNIAEVMTPLGDSLFAAKAWRRKAGDGTPFDLYSQFVLVDLRRDSVVRVTRHDEPTRVQVSLSRGPSWASTSVDLEMGLHVVDRARGRLCSGGSARAELHCADTSGARRIVRWQPEVIPFTAEDRREYEDRVRTNYARNPSSGPGDADRVLAVKEWPARFHPLRALAIDADGNTWVLEYAPDATARKRPRFRVMNPAGEQIAFASGFDLPPYGLYTGVFISSTAVLRKVTNADGVEQIGVFPIRK